MMCVWPASALTSIINVLLGKWKLVSSTSTTANAKPGVMKMLVSSQSGPNLAADSSARTVVVPTATTRPPRALQAAMAACVAAGTSNRSKCMVWSAMLSVFTG